MRDTGILAVIGTTVMLKQFRKIIRTTSLAQSIRSGNQSHAKPPLFIQVFCKRLLMFPLQSQIFQRPSALHKKMHRIEMFSGHVG